MLSQPLHIQLPVRSSEPPQIFISCGWLENKIFFFVSFVFYLCVRIVWKARFFNYRLSVLTSITGRNFRSRGLRPRILYHNLGRIVILMNSPEIDEEEHGNEKNDEIGVPRAGLRSLLVVLSSLSIFLLLSLSVLYVAVFIGNLSVWSPISVHSRCRIISSSVDLRSSKVCELGLLNYKTKHVFYPYERKKYRCHYDYYWASVFEVEYIDHSGQARSALAEAPNEALPYNCRPNFGAAWLTKDKFKVNGTYACSYTLGISKVNINFEGLFDCRSEDPSTFEMIKRYNILFTRILKSKLLNWESLNQLRWEMIAGAAIGYIMAFLSVGLIGLFLPLMSFTRRLIASRLILLYPSTILLKRICFFVAYFSFMSWVTIQYLRRLGLL